MLIKRRVVAGSKEIDDIFDSAASAGLDLIEVCWNKLRPSIPKVYGYDVPQIKYENSSDFSVSVETDVRWIEGVTKFYPDASNRCWGYIFDTPENREKLENSLATGWFFIVDKETREEIKKNASEKGKPTEHIENIVDIKKTARELENERTIKSLEYRLKEYQKKMQEVDAKLKLKSGEKAEMANNRALHGVKIPDRSAAVAKIEEAKNANKLTDYAA